MSTITALPCPPSLKSILFGGYVPPEIPGRKHVTSFDEPTAMELAARNRAPSERVPVKRMAIMFVLEQSDWITAEEIAEKTDASIHYTNKTLRKLCKEGLAQFRLRETGAVEKIFQLTSKIQPEH